MQIDELRQYKFVLSVTKGGGEGGVTHVPKTIITIHLFNNISNLASIVRHKRRIFCLWIVRGSTQNLSLGGITHVNKNALFLSIQIDILRQVEPNKDY